MTSISNPFLGLPRYSGRSDSVTYVSPEEITSGKLSGGHLEAICDIYFLSQLYSSIYIVYPGDNTSNNSFLDNIVSPSSNIYLCPVSTSSSLLSKLFLSNNRPCFNSFYERYPELMSSSFIVGCHRNILFHLHLFFNSNFSNELIFFKSYGSMFLHNVDNIVASFNILFFPRLFFAHFLSAPLRFVLDNLSFLLSSRIFITRKRRNVTRNFFGKIYHFLFGRKTSYGCSGPYYFFSLHKGNLLPKYKSTNLCSKVSTHHMIIGSLGDNTFPTAIYGIKQILSFLEKYSFQNNIHITWNIAGKLSPSIAQKILQWSSSSSLDVNFLGYVESVDDFYSTLDAYVVPVSGGSAMPIKALEAFCKLQIPIFVTKYIEDSCSSFFGDSDIIVR